MNQDPIPQWRAPDDDSGTRVSRRRLLRCAGLPFQPVEKLRQDTEENEKTGWIDQPAGVAQIPVKDAMKIIAEKGLPAVSAPPADRKK